MNTFTQILFNTEYTIYNYSVWKIIFRNLYSVLVRRQRDITDITYYANLLRRMFEFLIVPADRWIRSECVFILITRRRR